MLVLKKQHAVPDFMPDRSAPQAQAQPVLVREQGEHFVAIIQRDGGDCDTHHWVIVERADLLKLAKRLITLAGKK